MMYSKKEHIHNYSKKSCTQSKMFVVSVTFIILACISSGSTTSNAKISNKVILGTTQDFMMSLKDDGQHDNKIKLLISSIVDSSRLLNHTYTVIHFETGLGPSADLEAESFVRLVTEVDPNARILLTIRISNPNALSTESYTGRNYSSLLKIFNQNTIKLEGLSIELTQVEYFCNSKLRDMKTLPGKTKSSLKEFKRLSNIRIGYVLNYKSIGCTFHHDNINTADFTIVKVPLQRNDNIFVESYGAFKVNIENLITSAENVLQQYNKTNIYYQLTIKAEVTVNEVPYTISQDGKTKIFATSENENLKSLKNDLNNLQIGSAYQHLLTQYLNRWMLHDPAGISAIVSYQYGLKNTDPPWDHVTAIPYFMTLPLRSSCKPLRLPESATFLLQNVRNSGFNTIMINGDKWQELSNYRDEYIKPCAQPRCWPENVMYFNNQNDALANYTTSEIKKLANIGEMKLSTLVFSPFYNESKNRPWSNIMETMKEERKLVKYRERTCTEQTDFFQNIRAFNLCDNTCQALNLRKLKGCGSLEINSENIMWRGVVHIEEYSTSYFLENIRNKLDSLVIARQLIRKKYDSTNLPIFLRIVFNHTEKPSPNENKFPLYCSPFYNLVYQYYEIILTWARIHVFPIIIDPTANGYGFINPISWNPLITSRSGTIKELMKSSPLFIRRSYNLSTLFGTEWTNGMYPCLHHAEDLGSLNNLIFTHDFAGVTINMDVRTSGVSLTSDELKILLLYALGKFDAVEIILLTENHIQTLLDVLSEQHFDRVLQQNSIYSRKLYLQIPSFQDEPILEILLKLQQNGFKVHVNITNVDYRRNVQRNDNLFYGTVQENCTDLAYKLVNHRNDSSLKILSANISYLVCETFPRLATNQKKDIMHQYLETHLYMRMLFQHVYPNIKEVRFRLHPLTSDKTKNMNKMDILSESLFLADVNSFAQGHEVHYFLFPVLPRENTSEFQESSFWTVNNYEDLSDLSVYQEKLSTILNVTAWKPVPTWAPATTSTSTNSSESKGSGELLDPDTSKLIIYITIGLSVLIIIVLLATLIYVRRHYEVKISCTNCFRLWLENYRNTRKISGTDLKLHSQSLDVNSPSTLNQYKTQSDIEADNVLEPQILHQEIPQKNASELIPSSFYQNMNKELNQSDRKTHQDSSLETVVETYHEIPNDSVDTNIQTIHEIPKESIHIMFNKILGSGQFGIVYRAKMNGYPADVAVKMVHDNSPGESLKGMWSEIKLLCGIGNHSNVVKFIGCYTIEIQSGILWIVTELCSHGSLLSFLRDVEAERVSEKLTLRKLNQFSLDIAKGMDYIGARNIIHGDLSTRNVLLDEHYICKIGDFGLSRKMYTYEMYIKTSQEPLPWRWMAYESLKKLEFSVQSDVWGYGVTLWEIFTLGDVPYPGLSWSVEFVNELRNGLRLASSIYGNDEINAVMQQCWKIKPKERPSFSELIDFFEGQLQRKDIDDDIVQ